MKNLTQGHTILEFKDSSPLLKISEVECPGCGTLRFATDRLHTGDDFVLRSNAGENPVEVLVFMDSRGRCGDWGSSLAGLLSSYFEERSTRYLLVNRPTHMTTWATLVNFLHLNSLQGATILTNMGFVDFTPKKRETIEASLDQTQWLFGNAVAEIEPLEFYPSATGQDLRLFHLAYAPLYKEIIEGALAGHETLVINSPPVHPSIRIPRERPAAFFPAIEQANQFNDRLVGPSTLSFPYFDETLTYDAVHYTVAGNRLVFNSILKALERK